MKIRIFLVALLIPIIGKTQNTHPVKFQTPETSSFNRTIETPVSLSTGIPGISIPLYEIRIRGVNIPITLNYAGGGIKVEEEATWVGLGWNLNYGGQILRKQRGAKDEKFFMRTSEPALANHSLAHYLSLPNYSADPYLTAKSDKIVNAKNGLGDYMPDEFYYAAPGYSGRMLFNQGQNKFMLFPKEDVKPSYTLSNINLLGFPGEYRLDSWNLKLPNGTSIDYGTYGASTDASSGADPETRNLWGIKTVTNIYGDQIAYTYDPVTYTSYNLASETYNLYYYNKTSYINTTTFRTNYLNNVTFPGGRVEFVTTTRSDMPTKALSVINVYDNENTLVKKIEFTYSYFTGDFSPIPNMGISDDYRTKRLKLDKIKISAPGIQAMEYKFDYYNSSQYAPSKHSFAQDYWGFFNSRPNGTLIPKTFSDYGANRLPSPNDNQVFSLKTLYYPEGGRTEYSYECNTAHGSAILPSWFFTADGNAESFYVGGIRIKSIKNYNSDGALVTQKNYGYLNEYTGKTSGWLLSLPSYFENTRKILPDVSPLFNTQYDVRLFATSRVPLQTASGSFVGYETVTEEQVSQTGNLKSVYSYSFHDSYYDNDSKRSESEVIDANEWLRGKLDSVKYLKNNIPVKREQYEYYKISPHHAYDTQEDYVDEINTDFISWQTLPVSRVIEDFYDHITDNISTFKYYVDDVPATLGKPTKMPYFKRYTGFDKLKKKKTITYDGATPVEQEEFYYYDSTPNHHQLTRTESTGSKGNALKSTTKYPKDMAGIPYTTMVQNNIMNLPIEQASYNKGNLVRKNITNYLSSLYPDNEQEQIGAGPLETKITYKYDNKYNLREIQSAGGPKQSYLWDGVSFQYPTAEINNAALTDVAYTSFEVPDLISNGDGGWSFVGYADITQSDIPVGKRCYPTTLSTTFTKSGLSSNKTYDLSYWSKTGAYTVSGSQPATQLKTLNGWTQFKHKITGVATVTVSGTAGYIDELKIWPSESISNTYNYTSLGLMVYRGEPNEKAYYYEYDGIGRLKNIKDQNKDIIKDVSMNYKGVGPTIYKNIQITKNFIKTGCTTGSSSDSIPFTVYENSFSSLVSQSDANLQAQTYLNSAGQTYANTIGVCKFYNVEKSAAFAKNDCGSGKSGSSKLYVVSARSYSSTISQADADAKADADINANGQLYANNTGQCATYTATVNVSYNNQTSSYWSFKATNVSTGTLYTSSMGASYSGVAFTSLPTGMYTIQIAPLGPSPSNPTSFMINGIINQVVPASYSGTLTFNNVAINSASFNPLITAQAGFVPVSCSFSGSSGWQVQTFNISNVTGTQTNLTLIVSVSNAAMTWGVANTVGYITGACNPASQKTFNCTENGRTWQIIVHPTGQLTVRLTSGTAPAIGTQITFSGNYNL